MTDEAGLRAAVQLQLANGTLPSETPRRVWGGPGTGAPCHLCELPVRVDEREMELQFAHENDPPYFDVFRFHFPCFAAWEVERTLRKS